MDLERAQRIVQKMAKERYSNLSDVLAEFQRYQKDGEVSHFWPDESMACRRLIETEGED